MKKLAALVIGLLAMSFSAKAVPVAETFANNFYDGRSYIFVEGGVEFSVFPDGQFDFVYLGNGANVGVNINTPNVNVSFNSGYNYDAFVQYDDYGAVIQVEDVPIYYDEFGRIIQAGSVEIRYTNRRIVRVGGLRVFYNSFGYFDYCTGFISPFYRTYVYRPWHVFYARPLYASCIVYDFPYRRFYTPVRYSFAYHRRHWANRGRVAYVNGRRDFYRPGSRVHYRNGRTAINRDYNPNRRNTAYDRGRPGVTNRDGVTRGRPSTGREITNRGGNSVNRGRPATNREGVSRDGITNRGGSTVNRGRPANNREITNRGGNSVSKGRPASGGREIVSRGGTTNRGGNTVNRGRPSTSSEVTKRSRPSNSRGTVKKDRSRKISSDRSVSKRQNNVSRPSKKRNEVSRKSSSRKSTYSAPKRSTSRKSVSSGSKRSVNKSTSRGNTSRSRGTSSRRGRG